MRCWAHDLFTPGEAAIDATVVAHPFFDLCSSGMKREFEQFRRVRKSGDADRFAYLISISFLIRCNCSQFNYNCSIIEYKTSS